MEKQNRNWNWAGLAVTLIAGNLLHFVYEWTGEAPAAALFSAVNESTWEHMKLLAVPYLLFTLVQMLFGGHSREGLLLPRAIGLLAGLAVIPLLYYTYTGVLGENIAWLNVAIFQVAAIAAFLVSAALQRNGGWRGGSWQVLGAIVLIGIAVCFVVFLYQPPDLPLFIDPTTGQRGIG